jgi:hypothetical protein
MPMKESSPGSMIAARGLMRLAAVALALCHAVAVAAPNDVLFEDDFDDLGQWTVASSGGNAGTDTATSNSPSRSLRLSNGPVVVTSVPIAAAVPAASLDLWVRRGVPDFSCVFGFVTCTTDPESGEDLRIQYLSSSNSWVTLTTFQGGGTAGEILTYSDELPPDALHANLRIRASMIGGQPCSTIFGFDTECDYWYVDDPVITELAPPAPPFGLGACDDFENGLGNWSGTDPDRYGINSMTSSSPTRSLYTRGGAVNVTSNTIDLSGATLVGVELWVRRGSNSFSNRPESGEDLLIQYRSPSNAWVTLQTFTGSGTEGQSYNVTEDLPSDALHSGFALRFRQLGGSGTSYDYWHIDDVCLNPITPVSYSFEESSWSGGPGEVLESSGTGLNGTVIGGAKTVDSMPALSGNPGSCRYGEFDGVNDYIEIADGSALDAATELTVAAWIKARTAPESGGLHTILSKDWNYEYHVNPSRQVYWWWNDSGGTVRELTTSATLSLNQWHHVAITYRSGSQTIYIDGDVAASSAHTGALRLNDESLYIGTDLNFFTARNFDGFIDEVYILPRALTQTQVRSLRDARHECATAAAQFTINHDNFGIHCVAETITVDVVDADAGTPLLNYNATVRLDTQTGSGTWSRLVGSGSFSDGTADDGVATYDWPLGQSQAVFQLSYPQGPSPLDIDVYQVSDPGIRDTDAEGPLAFSPSGFTLTAAPLANPPGAIVPFQAAQTAGAEFPLHITAYGQTPEDPVCGVIESYTGVPKNLKFWFTYVDPASGTRAFEIDNSPVAASQGASASQPVTFTNGQAVVLAKYKDVGRAQLLVKDDSTVNPELPTGIRGATADFVVRPFGFALSGIVGASGEVNQQAADASGLKFIAAGDPFEVTATALDVDGDPAPNYGFESIAENVRLDVELLAPLGGAAPSLTATDGFGAFSNGSADGTDFAWHEVGIIRLHPAVGDGDYLGTGDVAGTPSERIGRFVPHRFDVGLNAPMLQTACTAGEFTYQGQSFSYLVEPVISTTARSAGGAPTLNYAGPFFKLATSELENRAYVAATGTLDTAGLPGPTADPVVQETGPGTATLTFGSGSGLRFDRALQAPFQADIELSIDVLDADGVAAANPVVFGAAGGMLFNAGREVRYGRVRLATAVGSEHVNLAVPAVAEHYAGSGIGFVPNGGDTCTTGVSLSFSGFTKNLGDGDTCALDSGSPGASGVGCAAAAPPGMGFEQPPVGGDFNLLLAAPGAGKNGSLVVGASVPDWLKFDWNAATPGDEDPAGQATFGIFGGDARQIYLREVY